MANKLVLELKETEVSLGKREFVLREMAASNQNKFYQLINRYAQVTRQIKDLGLVEEPTGDQVKEIERLQRESADVNQDVWNMMLIPNDDQRDRITTEWLDEHTNGRMGEMIIQEQLTLNDFDQTMGKLIAQALPQADALGIEMAEAHLGPNSPAPLAEAIISAL